MISISDLDIYIIEQKTVPFEGEVKEVYQEILTCFQESWDIYSKFKGITVPVDYQKELSYADELVGVFYQRECVAMIAFGHPDLNYIHYKDDKFLHHWDEDSIATLIKNGKRVQTLTKLGRRPGRKLESGIKELPNVTRWTDLINILINGSLIRKDLDVSAAMLNEESAIKTYHEQWENPPIRLSVPIPYYGVTARVHFAAIYAEESKRKLNDYNILKKRITFYRQNKNNYLVA